MKQGTFFGPALLGGTGELAFGKGRNFYDQINASGYSEKSAGGSTVFGAVRTQAGAETPSRSHARQRAYQTDRVAKSEAIRIGRTYRPDAFNPFAYDQESSSGVVPSLGGNDIEDLLRQNQIMNKAYQRGVSLYEVEPTRRSRHGPSPKVVQGAVFEDWQDTFAGNAPVHNERVKRRMHDLTVAQTSAARQQLGYQLRNQQLGYT